MQEGWLIRDGEVLASAICPDGLSAHAVSKRQLATGVGAVVVHGPAVVLGAPLARVNGRDQLAAINLGHVVHLVGFGRRAYVVAPAVASHLHRDDTVEFRSAS